MTAGAGLPTSWSGPGLLDLQLNGYGMLDFNSDPGTWTAQRWHAIRRPLARRGVLAALPTLVTAPVEEMLARADAYGRLVAADAELAAAFPGLHLEGPFLSPEDGARGAHRLRWLTDPLREPALLDRLWQASGGRVKLLTVAPELPGMLELVERATGLGICVALGHTAAAGRQLDAAVAAGARMSTHLGNGTQKLLPRFDNCIQAQLADDRLAASFIADGYHIPFPILKSMLRAKTAGRCVLVTDATMGAGMGPGRFRVGGLDVVVTEALDVARTEAGIVAGSILTLDRAVVNVALNCGVAFGEAWAMASTVPAELIGLAPLPAIEVDVTSAGFAVRGET